MKILTKNDHRASNQQKVDKEQAGSTWRCICWKDFAGFPVFFLKILTNQRFSKNDFKETQQSTLGAQFITHTIESHDYIMQFDIWDTAGQERFQSLGALYYKNSTGAIIVYDITSPASFQRAKSWVNELMENADPDI